MYYTVNTLLETLQGLNEQGLGNKIIVVSTDDEGNDYRELLDCGAVATKTQIVKYMGGYCKKGGYYYGNYKCKTKPDDIVLI